MRKGYKLETTGIGHRLIPGSFIPDGSTTAITTKYGTGYTVTRTGTGKYKVVLDQSFANFVSITLTPQFASSNDDGHQLQVGDISITNRSFEIIHLTSTNVATNDIAVGDISTSGTANKINFLVVVALSDIPGAGV